MTETSIVLTRRIPPAGLDVLRDAGVAYTILQDDGETAVGADRLRTAIRETAVLLPLLTERIDAALLQDAHRLRGIAVMAVGYNNIDVSAATAMGIPVSNTPGVLTETTADLTWALLLACARRIPEADRYMREGRYRLWGPELLLGADVGTGADGRRKVLGIIGLGRIGRAVARRAAGFDMDVIAYTPRPGAGAPDRVTYVQLDELLERSDFVSIHTTLNPSTHHMIGERELRMMKRTAYLVNVARGEVVDEAALVTALQERRIAGAALDVFEHEPRMATGLAECDNVVLAPHIGSATIDTRNLMAVIAARNALAHLRCQRAPDVVNPEVYETNAYRERVRQ